MRPPLPELTPLSLPPSTTADPGAQQHLLVWVVEDDPLFRETVVDVVCDASGLDAAAAFGTCEAMLAALDTADAPDVVLMDIGLPGMSGLEGIPHVRSASPTTNIIVLTVHEDTDKIFEAICAGATGYLLKPSSSAKIVEAIRTVHRGGSSINPRIARKVLDMFAQLAVPQGDYGLTEREREVLQCMVDGHTKKSMAEHLHLSYHTIDRHIRNVYAKLEVHSRSGAVAKALKERLL